MLTPELEQLIKYALEDGVLTDKERSILMRKAQEAGADLDEFEMILDAKLHEVQKAASSVAPKRSSNKHGEVRKCPACGAMVSEFTTRCTECGFEFSNVEANRSANTLFEKLQSLEMEKARELAVYEENKNKQLQDLSVRHNSDGTMVKILGRNGAAKKEEREDLIRSLERGARLIERKYLDARLNMIKVYTVPNTKGDLLELLSMASSSAYDNDGVIGPEEEVWLQKTDQIYQKLVICAAGDNVTLSQATNMIVSLIKRLPNNYKNFTRIPKELRDKINAELKVQKKEQNAETKQNVVNVLKGWRGITLAVAIVFFLIGCVAESAVMIVIGIIAIAVLVPITLKAIKSAKNDMLY